MNRNKRSISIRCLETSVTKGQKSENCYSPAFFGKSLISYLNVNTMPVESGVLLRSPMEVAGTDRGTQRSEVKFSRSVGTADFSEGKRRFGLGERDFQRQYFHIYSHR